MTRTLVALGAGALFGVGLLISGMIDPARVLGFLDIAGGAWDPTLAFVMAGAMAPMALAWAFAARTARPALAPAFPARPGAIDVRLIGGSALFGAGWGLAGFCPGPALAALTLGGGPVAIFTAAMVAGMLGFALPRRRNDATTPNPHEAAPARDGGRRRAS